MRSKGYQHMTKAMALAGDPEALLRELLLYMAMSDRRLRDNVEAGRRVLTGARHGDFKKSQWSRFSRVRTRLVEAGLMRYGADGNVEAVPLTNKKETGK